MNTGTMLTVVMILGTAEIEAKFKQIYNFSSIYPFATTKARYAQSHGPSEIHKMAVTNCSQVLVNRYLKEKCLINNRWYFKCIKSDRFYRVMRETCHETKFSRVCPDDVTFYQACGHSCDREAMRDIQKTRNRGNSQDSVYGPRIAVCGQPICQLSRYIPHFQYGNPYDRERFLELRRTGISNNKETWDLIRCRGFGSCGNEIEGVKVNEYGCHKSQNMYTCVYPQTKSIGRDVVCDGKCDCEYCDDEAKCNNMTVGLFCTDPDYGKMIYIRPKYICDGTPRIYCARGAEKKLCHGEHETCWNAPIATRKRYLTPRSKCSIPDVNYPICMRYKDQMNCTYSTISPLKCDVKGYPTTISEHVICKDLALCDDQLDDECIEAEFHCKIHKHKLCNEVEDCKGGRDEGNFYCKDLAYQKIDCVRRFSYEKTATKIPRQWIMDGVVDCMNMIDEDHSSWVKECGTGTKTYHAFAGENGTDCSLMVQLKCPRTDHRMNLDRVCSVVSDNCDAQVCVAARKEYEVISQVKKRSGNGNKTLFYCLPGLSNLEDHAGKCSHTRLLHQKKVIGIVDSYVKTSELYAKNYIDCRNLFGEYFVYVSCAGHCNYEEACPLKPLDVSDCLNFPKSKLVFSLAEDDTLALAIIKSKRYNKQYFACRNGVCIEFDKVCNLEDDCKDQSDEENCFNNFKCSESGDFIPFSKKCDGVFDCLDYSDECNEECENQINMFDPPSLLIVAWVFGISAILLNIVTLVHGLVEYPKLKKENALINRFFVLMITLGDLLQGIFLVMLSLLYSVEGKFFKESTCRTQFKWTTSKLCTALGVLSTIGSLLSLYSMTILSIIRASTIRTLVVPADGLSRKKKLRLFGAGFTALAIAVVVAIIPEIVMEDYFVQNLNYNNNPLFVGAPNKKKHLKIFEAYYGRIQSGIIHKADMHWVTIRHLVQDMFENGIVSGTNIGFYGENGLCLFSYFVKNDSSYRWFSMTVLLTNLLCVLIIGGCYVMVNIFATRVSGAAAANRTSAAAKMNRKLQRKITIIILTDVLTWLPFIIVCIINFIELVDTSHWYSIFCIFFLPINCIINPIGIYDETIYTASISAVQKVRSICHKLRKWLIEPPEHEEIGMSTAVELGDTAVESRETAVKSGDTAVESRDTAVKSRDKAVESGDTAVESGDTAVELGDTAVESGDTSVESGDTAVESGDTAVKSRDTAVESGDTAVESGDRAVESGDTAVESGDTAVESGDTAVESADTAVESLDTAVKSAYTAVESGDTAVESGDTAVESGDTVVESGDTAVESGDTAVESSDTAVESRDTAVESGDTAVESQDTAVESGDTAVESRDTAVESGDTAVESRDTAVESADTAVESADTAVESRDTAVESAETAVESGDTIVVSGDTAVESGDTAVESAETAVESGGTIVESGDTAVESGDTAVESADTAVESGDTAVESGDTAVESGDTAVESGEV